MTTTSPPASRRVAADEFTPKLVSSLREGYGLDGLRKDAVAGFTVAMVAIPLSMAIAKASGAPPEAGLYTAVVGGFLISLLGGSRYQIGGPAGAFIVLVAGVIERHGYDGLLLATGMAGLMMIAVGVLRLGAVIRFVPHPVVVGFTSGIAVIIFASQIVDLLGLDLSRREPSALFPKIGAIADSLGTANPAAIAVSVFSIASILVLRRFRPHWPVFLLTILLSGLAGAAASHFGHTVETIGSKFGGIPSSLPVPRLPDFSFEKLMDVLPSALAITLLGSIESLLSAVVADGITGRRHRSNCELVAQGVANVGSALFGGICATGTIARTATNIRAGATSPVAGIVHALVVLLLMLAAAPLAAHIPLAALAAVLAFVAWNMAEREEFALVLRLSRGDAAVLLVTFGLTIFDDLTTGIAAGVVLGSMLFMHRMASIVAVREQASAPFVADGDEETVGEGSGDDRVAVFRLSGPFFFGAASEVTAVLERLGIEPDVFILDLADVPFCDATGAHALGSLAGKLRRRGVTVMLSGAAPGVERMLALNGVGEPDVAFARTLSEAVAAARTVQKPRGISGS
jgi:SulP family sulfate permease